MRTPLTLIALALLTGCATRPPAPPPPDPLVEYLKSLPPFKYRQSTQLARLAADKCLAEHKADPEWCRPDVMVAESSESADKLYYKIHAELNSPAYRAPSSAAISRSYDALSTGSSNAGPTLYMEPRPGTSITSFGNGAWTSRQGGTICTGGNGTATCY